jgi:hypothetical protein
VATLLAPSTTSGKESSNTSSKPPKTNTVRLGAWNCTCAAFAFAAFPSDDAPSPLVQQQRQQQQQDQQYWRQQKDEQGKEEKEDEWTFGGMSIGGDCANETIPACKHLLACLLADRWTGALGRYVIERRIRREEMAGIVADV